MAGMLDLMGHEMVSSGMRTVRRGVRALFEEDEFAGSIGDSADILGGALAVVLGMPVYALETLTKKRR